MAETKKRKNLLNFNSTCGHKTKHHQTKSTTTIMAYINSFAVNIRLTQWL